MIFEKFAAGEAPFFLTVWQVENQSGSGWEALFRAFSDQSKKIARLILITAQPFNILNDIA